MDTRSNFNRSDEDLLYSERTFPVDFSWMATYIKYGIAYNVFHMRGVTGEALMYAEWLLVNAA